MLQHEHNTTNWL